MRLFPNKLRRNFRGNRGFFSRQSNRPPSRPFCPRRTWMILIERTKNTKRSLMIFFFSPRESSQFTRSRSCDARFNERSRKNWDRNVKFRLECSKLYYIISNFAVLASCSWLWIFFVKGLSKHCVVLFKKTKFPLRWIFHIPKTNIKKLHKVYHLKDFKSNFPRFFPIFLDINEKLTCNRH